jgi:hypothetical protein
MAMEETNTFRIFARRIVRKICGHLIEGECWRMRTN